MDGTKRSNFQELYNDLRPLFELGCFKEIYKTGEYCVCNGCNASYIAFPLIKHTNGQIGLIMESDFVKELIRNPNFLFEFMNNGRNKKYIDENLKIFSADEKSISSFKALKARYDLKPGSGIDLKMEEQLAAKSKQL